MNASSSTGWLDAKVAFIMSGGYQGITERICKVTQPTLVLWGKQDKILDPSFAQKFASDLQDARVIEFDECGHVPHLEQSERCASAILDFCMESTAVPQLKV